MRQKDRMTS